MMVTGSGPAGAVAGKEIKAAANNDANEQRVGNDDGLSVVPICAAVLLRGAPQHARNWFPQQLKPQGAPAT